MNYAGMKEEKQVRFMWTHHCFKTKLQQVADQSSGHWVFHEVGSLAILVVYLFIHLYYTLVHIHKQIYHKNSETISLQ